MFFYSLYSAFFKKNQILYMGVVITAICLAVLILNPIQTVRRSITQSVINNNYCAVKGFSVNGDILGGISVMNGSDGCGNLSFVNTSHCFSPICNEEIYTCGEERPTIL